MSFLGLTSDEMREIDAAIGSNLPGAMLKIMASMKRAYDGTAIDEIRPGIAYTTLDAALMFVATALGNDIMAVVYGESPPEDAPTEEHLRVLADRLFHLEPLFLHPAKSGEKSSIRALREELLALAAGDAPRLTKPKRAKKGRPINAYRLAFYQMKALAWDVFLQSHGNTAQASQIEIAHAFGEQWTTIARWKTQVIRELGEETYLSCVEGAKNDLSPALGMIRTTDQALYNLKADGEAYRSELRRRVEVA
ncbi:hypothetical protein [Alteraurantiacibacter buctensis]|uniref:Uncharacterized protein n=1 Tax=Alteraurantiacibacter buctensis TaxID=1503981 RepID=A0A844Z059_9SPHN|nr:hypothetical protein [Alteraurantiacibacter buctensis]MXO71737.1 hypothetical protein [Alteraurantiacibacter buctensis]